MFTYLFTFIHLRSGDEDVSPSLIGDLALGVCSPLIASDASVPGEINCLSDAFAYSCGSQQPPHFWKMMSYRCLAKEIYERKALGGAALEPENTLRYSLTHGGFAGEYTLTCVDMKIISKSCDFFTEDKQLDVLADLTKTTVHVVDTPPILEGLRQIRNHGASHSVVTRSIDHSSDLEGAFLFLPTSFARPFEPQVQERVITKWRQGSKEIKMNWRSAGSVCSNHYVSLGRCMDIHCLCCCRFIPS